MNLRIDRFELKSRVTASQRAILMERLSPHLRADVNAGEGAHYPIVSLYYDNGDRDCYWEKARGVGNRRKLRVRVYGSQDGVLVPTTFIEVKHKCEGRGVKRRVRLSLADALRVGEGLWPESSNLAEVDRTIIREIHDLVVQREFKPLMVMRYDRTAYVAVDPASDLRVTFDTGILCRMDDLIPEPDDRRFSPDSELLPAGMAVLEVKITGCIPYWISRVIAEAGCRIESYSKYSRALELHDPVLRGMIAPRWRRRLGHPEDRETDMARTWSPLACGHISEQVAG